jgi:hypothetical protein
MHMKGILITAVAAILLLASLSAAAQDTPAAAPKPPAQYKSSGTFTGGTLTDKVVISGIRFGAEDEFQRMVLDLEQIGDSGLRGPALAHPIYEVAYLEYPYRLVLRLQGTSFGEDASVQTKGALPFSIVTHEDGSIKEMQVFLPGPSEFKVIEIDDPAKLCIDVRPSGTAVPSIYTVQITGVKTASDAYALVDQGEFPAGYSPQVLVLGQQAVVEAVYPDAQAAAAADAALQNLGYASVINERRGDELPQA